MDNPSAAIGHLRRYIPPGYMKSVETGQNLIQDPKAKALYEDLRVVTQGPLWTSPRWRAIFRLNLYPKSYGIDDAFYRKLRPK
jgi:arabinofuranosyltransferase